MQCAPAAVSRRGAPSSRRGGSTGARNGRLPEDLFRPFVPEFVHCQFAAASSGSASQSRTPPPAMATASDWPSGDHANSVGNPWGTAATPPSRVCHRIPVADGAVLRRGGEKVPVLVELGVGDALPVGGRRLTEEGTRTSVQPAQCAVGGADGENCAVWGPGDCRGVDVDHVDPLPPVQVPDSNGVVRTGAGESCSVGRKGQVHNPEPRIGQVQDAGGT